MTTHDTAAAKPVTVRALGYPSHTRTEWAVEISGSWGKAKVAVAEAVETIFRTGELLERAKRDLGHGNWLEMAQSDLPFSVRQAQMLMKIARDARLTEKRTRAFLPSSVPILHALTLLDDGTIEHMMGGKKIHQHMTAAAVESAKYLERKGEAYLLKYKLPAKKKAKAAPSKAKAVAPPRPQPFDASTAKDLHAFVVKLAAYMRDAPPNITSSVRLLLPEDRRELAECASEAATWLLRIYEAAS